MRALWRLTPTTLVGMSMPSGPLGEPPWSWVEARLGFRRRLLVWSPQRSVAIRWRFACG